MEAQMNLETYVRSKRKQYGLTQAQLADRAGVGLRFIRELEGGKPTLRSVARRGASA